MTSSTRFGGSVSDEEWVEIHSYLESEVKKCSALFRSNPLAFWKRPNVGKLSERMRAYVDKCPEMKARDKWGIW